MLCACWFSCVGSSERARAYHPPGHVPLRVADGASAASRNARQEKHRCETPHFWINMEWGVPQDPFPGRTLRDTPLGQAPFADALAVVEIEVEAGRQGHEPRQVLFPAAGYTKRDLVDYYIAVGGDRASLARAADTAPPFPGQDRGRADLPEARAREAAEWVGAARVTFPRAVTPTSSAWPARSGHQAANLAVIDFHPWPSRRSDGARRAGSTSTRSRAQTSATRSA